MDVCEAISAALEQHVSDRTNTVGLEVDGLRTMRGVAVFRSDHGPVSVQSSSQSGRCCGGAIPAACNARYHVVRLEAREGRGQNSPLT